MAIRAITYLWAGGVDSILKDLEIVAAAARDNGTPMPITGLAIELYRLFVAKGL